MTEAPKCPYCGAEMKRITGRYLDGKYKSRYCCPKCDACSPSGVFCGRAEDAEAAALAAALRRAEPCASYQQLGKALCGKENATLDELLNAVEQLKRRAEPENRVLTLEELAGMANKYDWEIVWVECRSIKSEKSFLRQKCLGIAGEHGVWFVTPGKADDIFYEANSYNKTWRCWLRKPTAEEMEREKWND